jgi:hypothetical protein
MQRCCKISKQSVKNFPSFEVTNEGKFTFLIIKIYIFIRLKITIYVMFYISCKVFKN